MLCDWRDERCHEILRCCQQALPPGGTLLLIEGVVDPRNGTDRAVKLIDLEMGALTGGGLRTKAKFESLLKNSGFQLMRIHATPVPDCQIIEAQRLEGRAPNPAAPSEISAAS